MRRLLLSIVLCLAAVSAFSQNKIRSVEVTACLDSLGGASITELWDVNINSSNTEWYLSISNLGKGSVHGLKVKDLLSGEVYQTEAGWDVNRTREQKACRCGINRRSSDESELCWGVTSDGDHLWEVSYQYDNLITGFADSCAFNHMFISDNLGSSVGNAKVTVTYPGVAVTDSIASIWGFRFDGYVAYEDGAIVARADNGLKTSEGIIVMAAFDRSLFSPSYTRDDNFGTMKSKAMKGSDYGSSESVSFWEGVLILLVIVVAGIVLCMLYYLAQVLMVAGFAFVLTTVVPILWGVVTLFPLRMYLKRKRYMGNLTWQKSIPEDKDLSKVPYVMSELSYNILSSPESWDDNLTAAYIMRLIFENAFYIEKEMDSRGKQVAMLKVHKDWTLDMNKYCFRDAAAMDILYKVIKDASGADLTLQKKEIKNYKKSWGQSMIRSFYSRRKISEYKLTKDDAKQIMGLKNYLDDFTLSSEREIQEVGLWDEYLVYATAFGIADKVMNSMKKTVPDYFLLGNRSQLIDSAGEIVLTNDILRCVSSEVRSLHRAAENASSSSAAASSPRSYGGYTSRSSGGGGHSSHHGGGGHSGGGGGGGR